MMRYSELNHLLKSRYSERSIFLLGIHDPINHWRTNDLNDLCGAE